MEVKMDVEKIWQDIINHCQKLYNMEVKNKKRK